MTNDIERLNTEIVVVTPSLARQLRETCHYERQRPLSDQHIVRLAHEIEKDRFIAGTQVHFCKLGDEAFIVNGNHTLEAIVKADKEVPLTFLYTECRDEYEVGRIYARHDIGGARDWSASLRALGMYDLLAFDKVSVNAFGAAVGLIMGGFKDTHSHRLSGELAEILKSRDARAQMMREYREYATMYVGTIHSAATKHQSRMRRKQLFAIGLETFRYQPSLASEFWDGVARDDGLRLGDPRKTLIKYIIENTDKRNTARYTGSLAVAQAWNAFFRKHDLRLIRVQSEWQFELVGTPWGAKKKAASQHLKVGLRVRGDGQSEPVTTIS